ncbi:MAG: FG-GAP-like repeat-containing protein [Myxococcota bacterium]|nr:FG-GAP-like repeat-containing protein [Myxococcota bacterium]
MSKDLLSVTTLSLLAAGAGCTFISEADHEDRIDGDGDSHAHADYVDGDDCDDTDPDINPSVEEICDDGVDNNCDETAIGCTLVGEFSLSEAPIAMVGQSEGDQAGTRVTTANSFTTPDVTDVVVGAPGHGGSGAVYLSTAVKASSSAGSLGNASLTLVGDEDGDQAGAAVLGFPTSGGGALLVGAPGYDSDDNQDVGAVFLVQGPAGGTRSLSGSDSTTAMITETTTKAALGTALTVGDVDGDEFLDLWIGAPYTDAAIDTVKSKGKSYLWFGPVTGDLDVGSTDLCITGAEKGDHGGSAVALADLDGDGLDELILGSPDASPNDLNGSGRVHVLFDATNPDLSIDDADSSFSGLHVEAGAGSALAVGDTNGDGYEEVLVGAPSAIGSAPESGAAYLLQGPWTGSIPDVAQLKGEQTMDQAGANVTVGDVDADGFDDLIISAPRHDANGDDAGAVYLVYGPATGTMKLSRKADARMDGSDAGDLAGVGVAVGDIDGNGRQDILIGAPGESSVGTESGMFYTMLSKGL